ncbi:MAG: chemotaxis protein CheW [Myxococcota bacterium]
MSDDVIKRQTVAPAAPSAAPARVRREPSQVSEFLGFVINHETYAVPLHAIREILKVPPVTEVPRAPSDVLGIISVRGRIITVVDLRLLLKMDTQEADKHTRVLLVDSGDEVIGLLVDRVLQVYRLSTDEIELAGHVASDLSEHVMGIGRPKRRGPREKQGDTDEILILLDAAALLRR